jgi:hypothetical protein
MIDDPTIAKAKALGAITKIEAARRLDVPSREIVEAVFHRRIRFIMVDGIAFIPEDALSEYSRAS